MDLLLVAIFSPLVLALAMVLGLPKALARSLAYVGFALPAVISIVLWCQYGAAAKESTYAFLTSYDTGLAKLGINLTLGLNGISMPLFVMAGIVGLAAGLFALQSKAERLNTYVVLLLIMQGGLMGVFASVDVFFFYFFR